MKVNERTTKNMVKALINFSQEICIMDHGSRTSGMGMANISGKMVPAMKENGENQKWKDKENSASPTEHLLQEYSQTMNTKSE